MHRGAVGGPDLLGVVPAAAKSPDLVVGEVRDELQELGIPAEEVLPRVGPGAHGVVLVVAVHRLGHPADQEARLVPRDEVVPVVTPHDLDDVPARAPERGLELLDDLAVASDGPVQTLQVAVHDEDEVVELLPGGEGQGAERLRLVDLAIA
jgi:hypothetical protein